jgi:hypothetical protein
MKKLLATLILTLLIWSVKAQNIYVLGDYIVHDWSQGERETVAAVYKNGELLYTTPANNTIVFPKTIFCDSNENVYWMVNYSGHSEIWKNDQLFVTTRDTNKSIGNMYLSNDTLYYAGSETINNIPMAKIWKGENFTPYRTLGDGIHPSAIRNLDKDKTTGTMYYCGYVRLESINLPAVWHEMELLYTLPSSIHFEAKEICIDHGNIYTFNKGQSQTNVRIYKNESQLYSSQNLYNTQLYTFCAQNDDWYTYKFGHYGDHAIIKNGNETVLDFGHASSIDYNWPITKIKCIGNNIYATGFLEGNGHTGTIWKNFEWFQTISHCTVVGDFCYYEPPFPAMLSEWYYEIENGDGTVTYQHLKAENDTTINNERPTVIVRSNTQYDRDTISIEVTHEYVFERNGIVYWWNNELQEFTTLYNLTAEADDEWEIKVGTESIIVHVDSVGVFEYDGESRKMLHISDAGNIFNGDIVVGYGHMTSFFPEKLMNRSASYTVDGLRCYWVEDALLYHNGDEDCDAIYAQIHAGVEETTEDAAFTVYPNPANNVLFMETQSIASLQTATYRIANLVGQTVLSGSINAKTQQINIKELPSGMYFITVGGQTVKFVVK